jgi:hypothetical protein
VKRLSWIFGPCLAVCIGLSPPSAEAQQRRATHRSNVQKAAGLKNVPKFVSSNRVRQSPLSTFDNRRYSGIVTRPEQIRSLINTPSRYGRTQFKELMPTPVKQILDRRNLLTVRSPLARQTMSVIGRADYLPDEESGAMRGDYERLLDTVPDVPINPLRGDDGSFQDAIEARLRASADEYYQKATDAFTKRQFIQARNFFGLVKDVEPDKTRAYLGTLFISVHKGDFFQAYGALLRAIDLADQLDELRVDTNFFYKNQEDFRRRVENLNLIAQRSRESDAAQMLYAYYAWLNGDVGTAIDSAASAEKLAKGAVALTINKFREFLIQKRSVAKPAES